MGAQIWLVIINHFGNFVIFFIRQVISYTYDRSNSLFTSFYFFFFFATGYCSPNLVFILLSDIFDCITLENCDPLFTFVEEKVSTWTMVSQDLQVIAHK